MARGSLRAVPCHLHGHGGWPVLTSEHGMAFICFPEICKIWSAMSRQIYKQLLQKRVSFASCISLWGSGAGPKVPSQGHASHLAASLPLGSPANTSSCSCFQAVDIGIGTFAVLPAHASVEEGKVLPIERPMFILSKPLKMFYNLESDEVKIPGKKIGSFPYILHFGSVPIPLIWQTKTLPTCRVLSVGTGVVAQHPAPP